MVMAWSMLKRFMYGMVYILGLPGRNGKWAINQSRTPPAAFLVWKFQSESDSPFPSPLDCAGNPVPPFVELHVWGGWVGGGDDGMRERKVPR